MNLFVKNKKREKGEFQFYQHQFVEAMIKAGCKPVNGGGSPKSILFRTFRRVSIVLIKKIGCPSGCKNIIVTSRGNDLLINVFPYYTYNVIPVLWDLWPCYWENLFRDLKILKVKECFVTASQMVDVLKEKCGIIAHWIPEAIDIRDYESGKELRHRSINVYELGRQHPRYHKAIEPLIGSVINTYRANEYDKNGELLKLAFPTANDLLSALSEIQIIVCFPKTDTHPLEAGGIETLTQRYWEAMLSGCLIIGRAPQELINFIGYDPVINVDWDNPQKQITDILNNIEVYQELVNKNVITATDFGSWDLRACGIIDILNKA